MTTLTNEPLETRTVAFEASVSSMKIATFFNDPTQLEAEIAFSTPAASVLLEWVAKRENQPPQAWWDEEVNPFCPEGE